MQENERSEPVQPRSTLLSATSVNNIGGRHQYAEPPQTIALLRGCRQRPRGRRATYELAYRVTDDQCGKLLGFRLLHLEDRRRIIADRVPLQDIRLKRPY
jgi:hypothetical protein